MIPTSEILIQIPEAAARAVELRRAIHRWPELGWQEERTSSLVADTLIAMGWEVSRPVGTAVVGVLRGGAPGRTVALRADMDALPIQEDTGLPFASERPGVMHACGHDLHTAGLLGAAIVLTSLRDRLPGCIKLLFQPDEEGSGGAKPMIDAGVLEHPHVDAVFGAHVSPGLPAGWVGLKYGKAYAASDMFHVIIHGEGCHGASPQLGIDAVAVAAQVVTALQQIVSRRVSPTDSAVVTVGSLHAGTAGNVLADRAELKGILRTLGPEMRQRVRRQFTDTVEGVCRALGAQAEITLTESYPGVVNWDDMVDLTYDAARELCGAERVRIEDQPTMGTEDFGYFIQAVPGAFYHVGVGNPELGAVHPLHSPKFTADERSLETLIALHALVAARYLDRQA